MGTSLDRRAFMQTGAAAIAAAGVLAGPRAHGANERIRVGVIGVANRGGQLIEAIQPYAGAEIVALCDVDATILEKRNAALGGGLDTYTDYRKLLERPNIDAVAIATPDHWHALQMIHACEAGKDVYVEKPLSITIHEGSRMVEVARQTGRIVQVGLQRRSSTLFAQLREQIQKDEFGKITVATAYRITNMWPNGIGHAPASEPPAHVDWDLWLGPRPARPFQETIHPYKFRWWDLYSSQLGNWGVHYFDLLRWLLDEEAPAAVTSLGGKFAIDDDRTIPDTLQTVFEFASGRLLVFGQYEASGARAFPREFELRGTKAVVYGDHRVCEVHPEDGGQFQDKGKRTEARELKGSDGDLTALHMADFFDCIKSRATPKCDVEEGHKSTVFAHLGNIALAAKARIDWDPAAGRILSPESANDLLHYEYRAPWKL